MRLSAISSCIIAGSVLCMTGCGFMSQSIKDVDYPSVGVGAHRGLLWASTDPASPPCGTAFLLEKWGEPNERASLDGGGSVWTYHNGLKWVGASPVIIVPLPLFVPAGQEKINFGIKGDQVIFIKHETTNRTFVYIPMNNDHDLTVGLYNVGVGLSAGACSFKKIGAAGNG